ncbi:MAG: guanylate kinase [alpha proteobacterium MED-G10]|nr:guanylate kinase [Rickettsiales bacterium]PDH56133.1 MAG: guanylate kinase [alpha proteobacterium MED-G10]|tara:strand:- start:324 stop:950 length:627 start_codon:yes stop_codon:yes gene_type:complete
MSNNFRKGLMLVLSSPSGAGKTSICKKLLETEKGLLMSISYTTRPKRKSENDGEDYFFVKKKEFDELQSKNYFVESALVFDHYYGTPKNFIERNLKKGIDILFDIDWQGAQKLVDYSKNDVVSIFVLPPSNKILLERLKKRNEDSIEIVKKRMSKAKSEISHWIEYDYIIINDDIDKSSREVITILNAERKKRIRQKFIFDFIEKLTK